MKFGKVFFILIFIGILFGCSNNITGTNSASNINDKTNEISAQLREPPNLEIFIGEEKVTPVLGTYSWSYKYENGTTESIEADADSPSTIVEGREPQKVDADADISIEFSTMPITYLIREWDTEHNVLGIERELNLSIHEGKKIFELLGSWEQGNASYVFYLDIE
ncbi:hypothetical protein ACERII_03750 [Evansella sp. AB-rgal1]|uniref:hypothetical protein n=1 Tax=Evansella sp. AB-rgal1 TaxID=3242696 RepID=UPI00359D3D49